MCNWYANGTKMQNIYLQNAAAMFEDKEDFERLPFKNKMLYDSLHAHCTFHTPQPVHRCISDAKLHRNFLGFLGVFLRKKSDKQGGVCVYYKNCWQHLLLACMLWRIDHHVLLLCAQLSGIEFFKRKKVYKCCGFLKLVINLHCFRCLG